jgi:hypothetical protein
VNRAQWGLALVIAASTLWGRLSLAAEDPGSDVSVTTDLTAVIALQGLPCGKVVSAREQGDNDYAVTCEDGTGYRVFVNADGRVIVEKQSKP